MLTCHRIPQYRRSRVSVTEPASPPFSVPQRRGDVTSGRATPAGEEALKGGGRGRRAAPCPGLGTFLLSARLACAGALDSGFPPNMTKPNNYHRTPCALSSTPPTTPVDSRTSAVLLGSHRPRDCSTLQADDSEHRTNVWRAHWGSLPPWNSRKRKAVRAARERGRI